MSNTKLNYIEFSNPLLVSIYNTVNAIGEYKDFYLNLAKKLSVSSIIDVGCGSGLLTCELAKQGYQMIGIEPSNAMLDLARQSSCGKPVKWIEGDALKLGEFNADLAIMTGHVAQFHLEDEYWLNALKSIHKALRPGGYLTFESRNPSVQPWFKNWPSSKEFAQSFNDPTLGEVKWWWKLIELKGNRILYENRYFLTKSNEELFSINELIFRTRGELTQSLTDAGFTVENVYGNWDFSPLTIESPELIFVARKKQFLD